MKDYSGIPIEIRKFYNMSESGEDYDSLQRLLEKIYRERGFDFREYKETTLTRRLSRRLHARRCQTYADYARILDQDPAEYEKLFDDLTIKVTSFFRDEVAFKALEERVLPTLINKDTGMRRSLRIWSAGCATGEEPYSISMLLQELLGKDIERWNVTIIATDIDTKALQHAQEGLFSQRGVEGIRQAWLDKYFIYENKSFQIIPAVRDMVSFEVHNLVSDLPYHGMDLVVCRNVLIYFSSELQKRVLEGFHKGLNQEGFLLLGKAEVPVGESKRLFQLENSKAKLYRKNGSDGERYVDESLQASQIPTQYAQKAQKVVVIGASAGGIDALTQVLSHLPADLPAAVLVVQHLQLERETRLHEYLARHSSLRVCRTQDGMHLEAGVVYIARPGQHLHVENERLVLNKSEPVNYVRPSIDVLFTSAVRSRGSNVIGVILSGTGRDGTLGCREIQAKGGVTIAQNERTSRHFAMPKAAIDAGVVDYVLPLQEIADMIIALVEHGATQKEEEKI